MMSNYTPPAVEILKLEPKDVFLAASTNDPEGLYEDKWADQNAGMFY
ncbi:MAG: hypothetical protein IKA88_01870 [Clostridia bacterium]|nr:hypothetical protein [Clostridia bacterium]